MRIACDIFFAGEEMSEAVLTEFELMILLVVLRLDEDAYGVPISRELERHRGKTVALGSVYAALERLCARGLATSRLGDPTAERGGRARRYFSVTDDGVAGVRAAQKALVSLWRGLPQLEPNSI